MESEFIPYKIALELKELGFDEPCLMNHYGNERLHVGRLYLPSSFGKGRNSEMYEDSLRDGDITAILYQQVFRWFREKHNLIGTPNHYGGLKHPKMTCNYKISGSTKTGQPIFGQVYETYEEAELECLEKLIEIVKNGK